MKIPLVPIAPAALMALTVSILSSCSDQDNLCYCPYDKFFSEALDADSYTLYRRCYASLRSTDGEIIHSPNDLAGCNIHGTDGTMSDFLRCLFNMNELATDEAICAWEDSGVYKYLTSHPNEVSPSTAGFFLRVLLGIRAADTYISRYSAEDPRRTAEVRLLRALYHYYLLDMFGDCGENIGLPRKMSAYDFIEKECEKAMCDLAEPRRTTESDSDYGLMNRGVARAVLMRLYLNSEVYVGRPRYAEALKMAQDLIADDAYGLSVRPSVVMLKNDSLFTWTSYQKLFMADNGRNGAQVEAILPLLFDKDSVATYAATSFLTGSTFDSRMYTVSPSDTLGQTNGTTLAWGGNRVQPELIKRFTAEPVDDADTHDFQVTVGDDRALFFSKGRTLDIDRYTVFSQGYATTKFNALFAEGTGPMLTGFFSSSDFFLIRLAEAYMTAAEASWRMKELTSAASYVNALRNRAHAVPVAPSDINADFLLDEWSREFYFEGRRRTDLRRFGQYFGPNAKRWTWKGGVYEGHELPSEYNNYVMPDTTTVGARYLELYKHSEFKKPSDMYYVAGSGIVENSWTISGGDNFGVGIIPFAVNDSDIYYIDYLRTSMRFKLIGNIGNWDEQFGSGDYGSFLHNEPECPPIYVPAEGIYRICVSKRNSSLTVLRYFGESPDKNDVLAVTEAGVVQHFRRCNMLNSRCHSWMTDIKCDASGLAPRFKIEVDGETITKFESVYGMAVSSDENGFITITKVEPSARIRLIYNDIMRSCYFYHISMDEQN